MFFRQLINGYQCKFVRFRKEQRMEPVEELRPLSTDVGTLAGTILALDKHIRGMYTRYNDID